jgi:hypothetical protein
MQALILLLKAREASPKRGYFWRSWMATVSLVAMAKDLELHEHYDTHQMGKSCGSTSHDCIAKTRVWQMCFIFGTMIGGPQGKSATQRCRDGTKQSSQDVTTSVLNPIPWTAMRPNQLLVRTPTTFKLPDNLSSTLAWPRTSSSRPSCMGSSRRKPPTGPWILRLLPTTRISQCGSEKSPKTCRSPIPKMALHRGFRLT